MIGASIAAVWHGLFHGDSAAAGRHLSAGDGGLVHSSHNQVVRARFDAARTTSDNARHWENADGLSADAALNPAVRHSLVIKSRYEIANNGYGTGMVDTLARDTVGTGPRLQLQIADPDAARRREARFAQWMHDTKFAKKLRIARRAKAEAGEAFLVMSTNLQVPGPVKLDLTLYETEQVTSDLFVTVFDAWPNGQPKEVDGIVLDETGNPVTYKFLKCHPGSGYYFPREFNEIPANYVIHYFNENRPGQHRGVPEITPTLGVFANLRSYTQSVLECARNAASISFLLTTDAPPEDMADEIYGQSNSPEAQEKKREAQYRPMDVVPIERNGGLCMPGGYKINQLKPEQPTATHAQFVDMNINEMARPFNMPFNVAKGNSKEYNYSSGRLDHQTYFRSIEIERDDIEITILDRVYPAWEAEDRIFYPADYSKLDTYWTPHKWFWDGSEHIDPLKEAQAQDIRLTNASTNLANELGQEGRDWEAEMDQNYAEKKKKLACEIELAALRKKMLAQNGLTEADMPAAAAAKAAPAASSNSDEKENDDEKDAA